MSCRRRSDADVQSSGWPRRRRPISAGHRCRRSARQARRAVPRSARGLVGRLVRTCTDSGRGFRGPDGRGVGGSAHPVFADERPPLTAADSVAARDVPGGTAPNRVRAALGGPRAVLRRPCLACPEDQRLANVMKRQQHRSGVGSIRCRGTQARFEAQRSAPPERRCRAKPRRTTKGLKEATSASVGSARPNQPGPGASAREAACGSTPARPSGLNCRTRPTATFRRALICSARASFPGRHSGTFENSQRNRGRRSIPCPGLTFDEMR